MVTDGVQEFPDHKRPVFSLLQEAFDQEVYYLLKQLQGRTTIAAPVGYTLSDKIEDEASEASKS